MWVAELGSDIQLELRVIFDRTIPQPDCGNTPSHYNLLEQNGLEDRVEILGNVVPELRRVEVGGRGNEHARRPLVRLIDSGERAAAAAVVALNVRVLKAVAEGARVHWRPSAGPSAGPSARPDPVQSLGQSRPVSLSGP